MQNNQEFHVATLVKSKTKAINREAIRTLAAAILALSGCAIALTHPYVSVWMMAIGVIGIGWFGRGLSEARNIDTHFRG